MVVFLYDVLGHIMDDPVKGALDTALATDNALHARRKLGDRLLFAAATGWGYRIVAILCNLANISLLFRYLDKELLGIWFLMLGAQAFMGLFDLGFSQTLQRRIAFCKAACGASPDVELNAHTREEIQRLLSLARRVYTIISILVFAVLLIAGWYYFNSLNLSPQTAAELRVAWIIMSLGYAINAWGSMVESSLNGLGDIGWSNLVNLGAQIGTLTANWLLLALGFGLNALAIVWVIKGFATRVVGWAIVKARHSWVSHRSAPFSVGMFRDMMPSSLRWWLALVGYFMMTGIGQYLIARFLGAAALPDYAATYAALAAAQGAMVGIVTAGSPLFSQQLKAGNVANVRETVVIMTRYGLGGLAVIYGFLGIWGREAFELWLGRGHFVGFSILSILIVLMLAEAHQGMFQAACVAAERLGFYKSILIGGALTLGLSLVLIPRFGLIGAALSTFIGQACTQHWVTPRLGMQVLEMRFLEDLRYVLLPAGCLGGVVVGVGLVLKVAGVDTIPAVAATFLCALLACYLFYRKLIWSLIGRWQSVWAPTSPPIP
jgi:O-antigen/teichoic acid export membrane protein